MKITHNVELDGKVAAEKDVFEKQGEDFVLEGEIVDHLNFGPNGVRLFVKKENGEIVSAILTVEQYNQLVEAIS